MPDIQRDPAILKRRRIRRIAYGVVAGMAVIAVSIALARMEPAPPSVPEDTLLRDTVKRGSIIRQERGLGTLVPEDTRWIPATTEGRVEQILLRPGARVEPDSVILELSSPDVEQAALNARLALQSAEAQLETFRVQYRNELLTQESQMAAMEADYKQARMDADADERLAKEQLVSEIQRQRSALRATSLAERLTIDRKRLASMQESIESRLRIQQAAVEQARALMELQNSRLASLKVRPGFAGVLQQVPVEVGARIAPGTNLARVADPSRLKAELRIAETRAKDIEVGQMAEIDTRNGIIKGIVSRKDPAASNGTVAVDVTLTGELLSGAVPDLSVDGTIQLERLDNVLYVGRPSLGQDQSTIGLFKVSRPSGVAERVQVRLGRSSVNNIVVLSGLEEGDEVILSDMSQWDAFDRVRLR
jgi:HlyD family secretion protein